MSDLFVGKEEKRIKRPGATLCGGREEERDPEYLWWRCCLHELGGSGDALTVGMLSGGGIVDFCSIAGLR